VNRTRLVTLAAAAALLVAAAGYRYWDESRPQRALLPALPVDLTYVERPVSATQWLREGFVEMVSPVRPPSSNDGTIRIVSYVYLPVGAQLQLRVVDGEAGLLVPPGTRAERVEYLGAGERDAAPVDSWRVLDVRATAFAATEERFSVLRPRGNQGKPASDMAGGLLGISWTRGKSDKLATQFLGVLMRQGAFGGLANSAALIDAAAHLEGINACAGCHIANQRGRTRVTDAGIVNRSADASGLFQFTSIMQTRLPFETYRPRNMNQGDVLIARYCGAQLMAPDALSCPAGQVLEGELDVRAGVRANDTHTLRVCASRRAIAAHMDATTLSYFREPLAACEPK
jgi:hypothetical protein